MKAKRCPWAALLVAMTLLVTGAVVGSLAGCGGTTTTTTLPATTTQPTVSLAGWRSAAETVCADFRDSFTEGWDGSAPYAAAAEELSRLPLTSGGAPATFVEAMKDAAAAVEAFSVQIKQRVDPDKGWSLDKAGRVWVTPAGAAWFEASDIEFPADVALAMFAARDELERTAKLVGLEDFLPWLDDSGSTSTTS